MFRKINLIVFFTLSFSLLAQEGDEDHFNISGRVEGMYLQNLTGVIRETTEEKNRFYFNNIYLNIEGSFSERMDYIVEFQPKTSDIYQLGGFVFIAEALQGIGSDPDEEADERQLQIVELVTEKISELDEASNHSSFERVQFNYLYDDRFGIKLGRVRNPFGFWDDYSLFRNLSGLKTDPVTIGVSMRRTDIGGVIYGNLFNYHLNYEFGVFNGENTFRNVDSNNYKDIAAKIGLKWNRIDFGVNYYVHDVDNQGLSAPPFAAGMYFRFPISHDITILGEVIYLENEEEKIITRGAYLQSNFNLSGLLVEGLRWNIFLESYNSDLLKVDLDDEDELDYEYAGTYFQFSNGFVYSVNRNFNIGGHFVYGLDEEGDAFRSFALKFDLRF
jgi:hypothetical protein